MDTIQPAPPEGFSEHHDGSLFFNKGPFLTGAPSHLHDRPKQWKQRNSRQTSVRHNILGKADQKWKAKFPGKLFDGSYHAGLPSTWANQKLGLATVTHLSNHINTSLTRLTLRSNSGSQEMDSDSDSFYDGEAWNFFDGELGCNDDARNDDIDIFLWWRRGYPSLFKPH
jgi:hypothetical protein